MNFDQAFYGKLYKEGEDTIPPPQPPAPTGTFLNNYNDVLDAQKAYIAAVKDRISKEKSSYDFEENLKKPGWRQAYYVPGTCGGNAGPAQNSCIEIAVDNDRKTYAARISSARKLEKETKEIYDLLAVASNIPTEQITGALQSLPGYDKPVTSTGAPAPSLFTTQNILIVSALVAILVAILIFKK